MRLAPFGGRALVRSPSSPTCFTLPSIACVINLHGPVP